MTDRTPDVLRAVNVDDEIVRLTYDSADGRTTGNLRFDIHTSLQLCKNVLAAIPKAIENARHNANMKLQASQHALDMLAMSEKWLREFQVNSVDALDKPG